ncbi:MAG: PfkB family carbohydrate kinase, partial [Rickettsiales bacterium]|nr:PfkB family carbohydrate kinase [Rickettsiales bacterium]
MERKFKLLGLGSAIVDVLAYTDEEFIEKNNLDKGSMKLVDYETAISLYQKLGVATECSGGSAGNTCSGFAILGGKVAFLGKVKDDYLGRVFKKDIEKVGVSFPLEASKEGRSTSKCVIFVTEEDLPSGRKKVERTMATYLDFDVIISEEDITEEIISSAEMLFFEG